MTPTAALQDEALIAGTLAGETECFTVLMDRHIGAVRKRVRSMVRNVSDEDDLVQETFLKAWRHLANFRSEASFRTWITRVAINEVLQQHRRDRNGSASSVSDVLDKLISREESPFDRIVRTEARETVRRAVGGLPEKYRRVLILRDIHELTTEETAQSLQFGIPMVKTRLLRARQKLSAAFHSRRLG